MSDKVAARTRSRRGATTGVVAAVLAAALAAGVAPAVALGSSTGSVNGRFHDTGSRTNTPVGLFATGGGLVVAGSSWNADFSEAGVAAARHELPYGALDPTFGTADGDGADGSVEHTVDGTNFYVRAAAQDGEGRVVFVADNVFHTIVGRLTAAGALDTTFGGDGIVTVPQGPGITHETAAAVALDGDAIVLAGEAYLAAGHPEMLVLRFDDTGALDPTFGTNGRVTIGGPGSQGAHAVMAHDGGIVVAGADSGVWSVARLDASGALDVGFGSGGTRTIGAVEGWRFAKALSLASIGTDIVVGGVADTPDAQLGWRTDAIVTRLDATGATIDAFDGPDGNEDGLVAIDTSFVPGGDMDEREAIALVDGTTVFVAGYSTYLTAKTGFVAALDMGTGDFVEDFGLLGSGVASSWMLPPVTAAAIVDGAVAVAGDRPGGYAVAMLDPATGGAYSVFGTPRSPNTITAVRGDRRATVSWVPPPDEGGAEVTGYVVSWSGTNGDSGSVDVAAPATSRAVTGLVNGVSYLVTVASVSEVGTGPTLSTAWVTPAPPPVAGVVTRPGPVVVANHRAVALTHGTPAGTSIAGAVQTGLGTGAWTVSGKGQVYVHGDAHDAGDIPVGGEQVTDLRVTPTGAGYWLATVDGDVYALGDAQAQAPLPASRRTVPFVAMEARSDGAGYWMLARNGRVHARGSAPWYCNATDRRPFVAIARTPKNDGYWLVTDRGRVVACGRARFYGSAPAGVVIAGIVPSNSGRGYALVTDTGRAIRRGDA